MTTAPTPTEASEESAIFASAAREFAPHLRHALAPVTIGHLNAHDIGRTVRFTDGGATYLGQLVKVDHETWPGIRDGGLKPVDKSWVRLVGEHGWSHLGRHPVGTPVEFVVEP